MPAREYKLRLPREVPEATSETVAAWLEEALDPEKKFPRLPADPGGGPVRISISLDPTKVVDFANKAKEKKHIALRRLIASKVKIEPVPESETKSDRPSAAEAKELLPERVLPRKLSYESEDFLGFVQGMDKGLAFTYRKFYKMKELKAAETPEEDRKLAGALAEVCNRRSPAWMLANADLVKLAVSSFRWAIAQTEDLDGRVLEKKSNGHKSPIDVVPQAAGPVKPPQVSVPASAAPRSPAEAARIAADELQHMEAPVQLEGEF